MTPNPYEAPKHSPGGSLGGPAARSTRGPFVLAAVFALLASAYWGVLSLLIGLSTAAGSVSGFQLILPFVLVALYGYRGFQLFKGDPAAAKRILWLHAIGAIVALLQIFRGHGFFVALQSIKVAINVLGALTAHLAVRAYEKSQQ